MREHKFLQYSLTLLLHHRKYILTWTHDLVKLSWLWDPVAYKISFLGCLGVPYFCILYIAFYRLCSICFRQFRYLLMHETNFDTHCKRTDRWTDRQLRLDQNSLAWSEKREISGHFAKLKIYLIGKGFRY